MDENLKMRDVFIIGSKGIPAAYGGFETFVDKLTEYQQNNDMLKYHVACMNKIKGEFSYHNARCFNVNVPSIGAARAIYYDIAALNYCIEYIVRHNVKHPIIYILACRIGLVAGYYKTKIHKIGGILYINPDGHEWMRTKWSKPIRLYWKLSEKLMIKHADLVICDSINIEQYIRVTYRDCKPNTTYIPYGADMTKSILSDEDTALKEWYAKKAIKPQNYYLMVGRFVPENNYDIIIREFMKSSSLKDLVIVSTFNERYYRKLEQKLHFMRDPRIKFVGTVYNKDLLQKVRENAYGYIHGHEVGGTNPSLLEALSSTKINLLLDVSFNHEVGMNGAVYWNKDLQNLAHVIEKADAMKEIEIQELAELAKARISSMYSWEYISNEYSQVFQLKEKNIDD